MRIEKLRSTYNIRPRWIHFPLHPETPEGGITLEELFAGRDADLPAMKARLQEVAAAEGLPLGNRQRTYNSRLAQELAAWADSTDSTDGEAIHDALFRAYFADGRNISEVDTLIRVAEGIGLDGDEARQVLGERTFRDAVDRDWLLSRQMGVTGVPTFVADGRGVVGAQPYDMLERLVLEAGAQKR